MTYHHNTLHCSYIFNQQCLMIFTGFDSCSADEKGFTKTGKPCRRRKFKESLREREIKKKQMNMEKRGLKEPCTEKCYIKCNTKFTAQERKDINAKYIALDYESQGLYIKSLIDVKATPRSRNKKEGYSRKRRNKFYLKGHDNTKRQVCKTFFLTTLGYMPKNDSKVLTALKKPFNAQKKASGNVNWINKCHKTV